MEPRNVPGQRSGFWSTRAYLWSLSVSELNFRFLRSPPICCRALLWLLFARARLLRLFAWTNIVLISNHPQNRPRPDLQDGPGYYLLLMRSQASIQATNFTRHRGPNVELDLDRATAGSMARTVRSKAVLIKP